MLWITAEIVVLPTEEQLKAAVQTIQGAHRFWLDLSEPSHKGERIPMP